MPEASSPRYDCSVNFVPVGHFFRLVVIRLCAVMIAEDFKKYTALARHGRVAVIGVRGHDLGLARAQPNTVHVHSALPNQIDRVTGMGMAAAQRNARATIQPNRSEEHTSELQSLMRSSYAVFCLT